MGITPVGFAIGRANAPILKVYEIVYYWGGAVFLDAWRIHKIKKWESDWRVDRITKLLSWHKLSDAVMFEGIAALDRLKSPKANWGLADLHIREDLSGRSRAQAECSLLTWLMGCGERGEIMGIAKLLEHPALNSAVSMQANASLLQGIKVCREKQKNDGIAELAKGVVSEHNRDDDTYSDVDYYGTPYFGSPRRPTIKVSEVAVPPSCKNWSMAVIEEIITLVPLREWHHDQRAILFKRDDLSLEVREAAEGAALLEVVSLAGKEGCIMAIADLLVHAVSVKVIEQANASLLESIKALKAAEKVAEIQSLACGVEVPHTCSGVEEVGTYAQGGPYYHAEAVNYGGVTLHAPPSCKNWSMAVIQEIMAVVPLAKWYDVQRDILLKRTDLSPGVKQAAEEALRQKNRPTDSAQEFDLER
jgi:hypothetical protein